MRGLNDWEDADAIFVVGGYLPSIAVVEREAAVLARIGGIEVNLIGDWSEALQGVRMRDGLQQGIRNRVPPIPLPTPSFGSTKLRRSSRPSIGSVRFELLAQGHLPSHVGGGGRHRRQARQPERSSRHRARKASEAVRWLGAFECSMVDSARGRSVSGWGVGKDWKKRDLRGQTSIVYSRSMPPLIEGTCGSKGQRGHDLSSSSSLRTQSARTVLEFLVGSLSKYDGPPDRPLDLPLLRPLRVPLVTDAYTVNGREFIREDRGMPDLSRLVHGAILVGGSVEP